MATNDNGLIAVAYAPSVIKGNVGNGKEITIHEETNYPFNGSVKFRINTLKPLSFPLYLRIPGWADNAEIRYKDKTISGKGGSTVKIVARWNNDDMITMNIPMEIRVERRYNNSMSILRGPLYFSLRIDKNFKNVKINYDNFGYKGSVDWEIYPVSAWNYGLMINKNDLARGLEITENQVTDLPFADKGDMFWSADSSRYVPWDRDAAVVITTRGMKIPEWTLKDNSSDIPPLSLVKPEGTVEIIQLVPYGCAKLRITEFPVIDITQVVDIIK
jgi:hypothetical protein